MLRCVSAAPGRQVAHAGVHMPPPLLFVGAFGAGLLLNRIWPARLLPDSWRAPGVLGGWLLVLLWVVVFGSAMWTFYRARTALMPNRPARGIVKHGPYRISRNPMYVSLTALYLGGALLINSLSVVLVLPLALLSIQWIILREERYLRSAFGEEYEAYCARVRRWL